MTSKETCPSEAIQPLPSILPALLVGMIVLCLDQLTKYLTYLYLPSIESQGYHYPYGGVGIFKDFFGIEFSLVHMTNKGAAWGMLGSHQQILVIFRIVMIAALMVYFFRATISSRWKIALACIIAGAVGNVIDYFAYGHVVDMFHFVLWGYDFPVFNVADSAITLGLGFLLLVSWIK